MTHEEGGDGGISVPPHHVIPHYHGDGVRAIFVASAVLLIVAKSTGAEIPLSTFGTVVVAVILVVAAGVTNPASRGIHWLNATLAIIGTLLFGRTAVNHYSAGTNIADTSFLFVEALALLSLIALYFTTRTIRGIKQRPEYFF